MMCWLFCSLCAAVATAEPEDVGTREVKLPDDCGVAVRPEKLSVTSRQLLAPKAGIQWGGQTGGESTLDEDEGFVAVFVPESGLSADEFSYVATHPRLIGIEFIQCDVNRYDFSKIGRNRALKLLKMWEPQCKDNSKWRKLAGASIDALSMTNCEFLEDSTLEAWSSIRGLEVLSMFQGWAQVIGARENRPAGIAAMELSALPKFGSLTDIAIKARSLTKTAYSNVWRCKSLAALSLEIALANDANLEGVAALSALTSLTINGTAASGSFLAGVRSHACLERLELIRNAALDGSTLSVLGTLPNLETVHVRSSPGMTGEQLSFLAKCPKLRHLVLSKCEKLTSAGLKWLLDIKELRTLVLDENNQLTARVLELAGYNKQLKYLSLSGCEWVMNKQLEDISEFFSELEFLNVVDTKCTGVGLSTLADLKGLQQLWVDSHAVSKDDIAKFSKAIEPREVVIVRVDR